MALNGMLITNEIEKRSITFSWIATQNIENNTSTISWTLKGSGSTNEFQWVQGQDFRVYLNHEEIAVKNENIRLFQGTNVLSGRTTISHDNDGSKQITFQIKGRIYNYGSYNATATQTFTLDTIPRKSEILECTQTFNTTSPNVTARADLKTSAFKNVWQLYYQFGGNQTTIWTSEGNNFGYSIPRNHLDALAVKLTASSGGTVHLKLTTKRKNNNIVIGEVVKNINFTFGSEYAPIINEYVITEKQPKIKKLKLNTNTFVRNKSLPQAEVSYTLKNGAKLTNIEYSVSTFKFNTNPKVLPSTFPPGIYTVNVKLTDSRGLFVQQSIQINILEYFEPKIESFDVIRSNDGKGEKKLINAFVKFANIGPVNERKFKIEYKEVGADMFLTAYQFDNFQHHEWLANNFAVQGTVDRVKTYEVKLTVEDSLASYSQTVILSSVNLGLIWGPINAAVGFVPPNSFKNTIGFFLKGILYNEHGKDYVLEKYYPVGIIIEFANNVDPNVSIGGRWEAFAPGRITVGLDASQIEFNELGKTGGAKTHTLTLNEMPSHNHKLSKGQQAQSGGIHFGHRDLAVAQPISSTGNHWWVDTLSSGSNRPHNNLQPYVVVKKWMRTE